MKMRQFAAAIALGTIFGAGVLALLGAGPGTVTFPNSIPYGVVFGGSGEYHSTTAIVDSSNPNIGAQVDGQGLHVVCAACGGGGSSGIADESAFTQGTTLAQPIGGEFTNAPVNLTSGQFGAVRLTNDRTMFMNLANVGGSALALGQTTMAASIPMTLASNQSAINIGTHTATNMLLAPGTNGFTTTPFSVLTTELNALASAAVATSSVNGTSGVFSQTNSGNAIFGRCWMKLGAALGGAAAAGANFSVWFLTSTDGGTTFESQTVSPPPRSPDIIIPVGANAYGANAILMSPPRQNLWSESVKIVLQNNTGQAMGASGNILTCAPEAIQQ